MRILLSAIYPYFFLLLFLIIPFDDYIRALPNILVVILLIAFPFVVKKEDFKKLKSRPILLFLGFLAYLCINSFFSGRIEEDFNIIKKVMLAAGLAILYIPINDINLPAERAGKLKEAIIFSALAAILFTVYNFMILTHASGSFALGESPQIIESLLVDRLYLGMLCVFSIVISFQGIQKKYHPNNNYYLANIFINIIFIIIVASKIAMVSLFVLILIRQFYGQRKIWKMVIAIAAILSIIGWFFIIKDQRSSHNNDIENQRFPPAFIENSLTYELRAVIWDYTAELISEEGFTLSGIGFDETKNRLVASYETKIANPQERDRFVTKRYNTHNQFLDLYLSAGFIALLLFLAFIIVSFISNRKQFFPTAMLALLVLYCLLENPFNRQIGAYFMGFILITLIASGGTRENNSIKKL